MVNRVDDQARKLYWRERNRVMSGARSGEPVCPEDRGIRDANMPLLSGGTPVEVLGLTSAGAPEIEKGVGWTTRDAQLPELAGVKQEGWPSFESLAEITGREEPEAVEGSASAASLWRLARRMMAQEWRRALNKPIPDPSIIALEDSAARIREEIGERESRKALEERGKQRAVRQLLKLTDALIDTAGLFIRGGEQPDLEEFLDLFLGAVRDLGFVFDIRWDTDGCEIWLEPWDERRLRRMRRDDDPVVYDIGIDPDMQVVLLGIGRVDDIPSMDNDPGGSKEDKDLMSVLVPGAGLLVLEDGEDPELALKQGLSELGRAIGIERSGGGWNVELLPWDEVRARRLRDPESPPDGHLMLELDQDMVIKSCTRKERVIMSSQEKKESDE